LKDEDIPHRTKLRAAIIEQFQVYFNQLKTDLAASVSKISFTADVWSSFMMKPYLAITAHWLEQLPSG
ncbi:hypothetical protein BT96DRAFT_794211, partial [Gymnopus androsaceus JB14]